MLTGRFDAGTTFAKDDFRSSIPRFQPENLKHNVALVDYVRLWAQRKETTPARIALAWLLAQRPWIVPIPGTKRVERIEDNIGAAELAFTPDELADIRRDIERIDIVGGRYPADQEALTNR